MIVIIFECIPQRFCVGGLFLNVVVLRGHGSFKKRGQVGRNWVIEDSTLGRD
jgi:hypothetical protein